MAKLGPKDNLIFRITHIDNMPWIFSHGLHCARSNRMDPNFVPIGNQELIAKRATHQVPITPYGTLSDYVSFYFTHHSIMMFNIKSGRNLIQRSNPEIVIIVSSLDKLRSSGVNFLFTNSHAYMLESEYYNDLSDLDKIDWDLLKSRNFKRDPEDPGKLGRYQAEALAFKHVPADAFLGIACYDQCSKDRLDSIVDNLNLTTQVKVLPEWYF